MPITNFPDGVSSFGVPITPGSVFAKTYFVDPTNGSDGNDGLSTTEALKSLTQAFLLVRADDTIICAGGNFTGNYSTPLNAVAPFVTIIGAGVLDNGFRSFAGATTASSPIIDILARGWRIFGFEFDCPTAAAAIRLTKVADSTSRCDFFQADRNIFTTGQTAIEVNGGGTHIKIRNNKFDQLTTAGGGAIVVESTSVQIPAFWEVENNQFKTNVNHISSTTPGAHGFSESTFKGNVFQSDGVSQDVTTILDIRDGGGGGNMVLDNYFDIAKASFTASTQVRGNATDYAAGNHFLDGEQQEAMNVS